MWLAGCRELPHTVPLPNACYSRIGSASRRGSGLGNKLVVDFQERVGYPVEHVATSCREALSLGANPKGPSKGAAAEQLAGADGLDRKQACFLAAAQLAAHSVTEEAPL